MDVSSLGEALASHQEHKRPSGRGGASAGAGAPAPDVLAAAQSLQAAAAPAPSPDSESSSDSSDSESSAPHARAELERQAVAVAGPSTSPVDTNANHARPTSPVGASSVSSWESSEDEADSAPMRGEQARDRAPAPSQDQASVADGDVSEDEAEQAEAPSSALFGGPRTKNEVPLTEQEAPVLEVERLPQDAPIAPAGRVLSLLGSVLVVEGHSTAPPLDEGTMLCMPDRGVIGKVEEVFGQVSRPNYVMRLPPSRPRPEGLVPGADVMFSSAACSVVNPDRIRDKGCDASNMHDEEIPAHEMEYSDDETEAMAKRKAKTRRRGRGEGGVQTGAVRGPQGRRRQPERGTAGPAAASPPRPFPPPFPPHPPAAPMQPSAPAYPLPRPPVLAPGAAARAQHDAVSAGMPVPGGGAGYGAALLSRPAAYPATVSALQGAAARSQAGRPMPVRSGPGVGGGYGTGLLPRPGGGASAPPPHWAPPWQQQQQQQQELAARGPHPPYAMPPPRGGPPPKFQVPVGDPFGFGAPPPPPSGPPQ